jgi:hypothetical protein
MALGGNCDALPVVVRAGEYISAKDLKPLIERLDRLAVFEDENVDYDEDADEVLKRDFEQHFDPDSEIFLLPTHTPTFLRSGWPANVPDLYVAGFPKSAEEAFTMALASAWGDVPGYSEEEQAVGDVLGTPIVRSVRIYDRSDV